MSDCKSEKDNVEQSEAWFGNIKRTYDAYQSQDMRLSEKMDGIFAQHVQNAVAASDLALKNAVDTANLVNKQAVAHRDVAIDRVWNVDEQGYTSEAILDNAKRTAVDRDAIAAIVVSVLAEINKKK